jgi:Protein of unknown function (DUF1592)/Protein of unknown function (DUF1588)/Protein of unknown function (DUF1587)/Protein of unknown function (DUF1585)/Protein of unknown function (DUF1595)
MRFVIIISFFGAGALAAASGAAGSFEKDVRPILNGTCGACHNEKFASGGLDASAFLDAASIQSKRDAWERILAKLKAGEMPPPGVPRPPAERMDALIQFVQGEFNRIDASTKPDPGRVTAHRLNRNEYSNTIRDLLGLDFRAADEFPADDSGYGFDNIGDVLTVSPTLMQKYLSVAERLAARAVGGDPLPKPGFFNKRDRQRRIGPGSVQLTDILEYDADYVVRVNLTGHRGAQDKPVTLVISVDGKPLKTVSVPVQISAVNLQGGATQRGVEETRVFLPGNEHTFLAEFVNDEALKNIPENARLNTNRNIFPESIELAGPFPPAEPHTVQRKILICDPASGAACVERILSELAHRAYRRPPSKSELGELIDVFNRAKRAGYPPVQSLQFAVTAALVSPQFLFRIERDPKPGMVANISDIELATRLSYFLWSSMPDDELLRLGESNRLHQPATLDAQVKRMIADLKSAAFSENFAGQWLETRSLDALQRDAKKFPEWNTDLKESMRNETRLFFDAVLRDDRPISDFIDGKYTFLNERLAKHYGIEGVAGPEFRRVELTTDQRSGVFTQGSVLTVSAYPTRTSVVLRGKYLLENVLNAPPPPKPDGVPDLNEESVGVARSLRQQMEQHRSDALCASCHSKMDPLGFALENYDATGKWRTADGKFPIDASGAFPNGKTFNTPAEMKALLKDNMPAFSRALAAKMLTYALGRGVEPYDRLALQELVAQNSADGYKMQSLVLGIVHSAPFRERRGEPKQKMQETASK